MRQNLILSVVAAAGLLLGGIPSRAEEMDAAAMAKALTEASVSLDQGLKASARDGTPISGKYEIEHGALQLSVYTMKGTNFSEVIVDHKSGAVKKSDAITEGEDLKAAKSQAAAMTKAKLPLDAAVGNAVKVNAGYRAVSVEPMVEGGRPVATVVLMKGQEVKKVTEKLD